MFSQSLGKAVRIRVDSEAEKSSGFNEGVVRDAKANGRVLGLKSSEFD